MMGSILIGVVMVPAIRPDETCCHNTEIVCGLIDHVYTCACCHCRCYGLDSGDACSVDIP